MKLLILYVTFDGLLQPLGRSQVVRYLEGLAARGWSFAVLSLEREEDLLDGARVASMERRLEASGIMWLRRTYRAGGARNVLANVADATAVALEFAADHEVQFTHARSYLGGGVALTLQRALGVEYLFDMRGYWIDERLEDHRWFTNPATLAAGRRAERALFRHASAVVSLATPAAEDIEGGRFGPWDKPVEVIPTCVDDTEFTMGAPDPELAPELHDKLVIGYVGSLNTSYRYRDSFELARHVLRRREDAHLLCLTAQEDAVASELDALGIPRQRRTITRVPHGEVARWMRLIDWGLLILNEPFAKRGSMPTKLAEFFATGIRTVAYGCNAEVVNWVERAGSGFVLESTVPRALRLAANTIADAGKRPRDNDLVGTRARKIAMEHFSASSGVDRYHALYRQLAR